MGEGELMTVMLAVGLGGEDPCVRILSLVFCVYDERLQQG